MILLDQLGNTVTLERKPRRIVSLVPSQTEFLWDIGLRDELVGVTRFCVHPPNLKDRVRLVGGTKKLNLETIRTLDPDLIVANKEENDQEQINALQRSYPVYVSDVSTFDDAYRMMSDLGRITGRTAEAEAMETRIREVVNASRDLFSRERVAYFIWSRPYMFAGGNTFIDHVLTHIGLVNVAGGHDRYPQLEMEDLRNAHPAFCFLSSEPYPFNEKHVRSVSETLPGTKPVLVDGEIFSWYGSRLLNLHTYAMDLKSRMEEDHLPGRQAAGPTS